nr:MerR family DNA-binding transcriptional regulator [Iodidimonas gelatinilytica]
MANAFHSTASYSIADLSREFGVTPRALRFYEDQA